MPLESTLAFQLMSLEAEVSEVPEQRRSLLRSVLEDSFAVLPGKDTPPSTRGEFLAFADAI